MIVAGKGGSVRVRAAYRDSFLFSYLYKYVISVFNRLSTCHFVKTIYKCRAVACTPFEENNHTIKGIGPFCLKGCIANSFKSVHSLIQ